MKTSFSLIICILLSLAGSRAVAQDPSFYIFLAFGQSNMEGHARFEPEDTVMTNDRFRVLSAVDCTDPDRKKGVWYIAKPPLCRCDTGLTPTDYFGRTLTERLPDSIRIGVINVSVGGCKIELFDKDHYTSYVSSAPDWLKSMVQEYGGNPYERLVEMAKIAQKQGVIKGILLHQGESDTGDISWPEKVKTVYANLLDDLSLKAGEIPLLAGELVGEAQGGKCASMNTVIRTLPETIPTAYIISSEGCEAVDDGLHFSAAGYRVLGQRYGEKMYALLSSE
ncbi:sialate O-acetylesterase [Sinomicrobium oceani]|uniref:sialate O-acetylesterase n=1 Tax=Sinomicrobium oceani TaxID=1150368 RepID=UPI00227BAB3D|nr:sialate O-acetylesterase [Sinomicrobium oceani]